VAYITRGKRLLVFCHTDFPEAGIQVPAGTVAGGEEPDDAVLREAREETGLETLTLERFLGEDTRDASSTGRNEVQHRRFYHLRCEGDVPDGWRHFESDPSDGSGPIAFDFFWVPLPHGVPELAGEQDAFLSRLCEVMGHSSTP
jgi:8-oxo-dGTP pyrophosphatase MutT (NUDIX family)